MRKVFFSFHYAKDCFEVSQIRNCDIVSRNYEKPRFLDRAAWESIKLRGDAAIKSWIDDQMHGASVTAVIIGQETYKRPWVRYEIEKSYREGRGLFGITIEGMNTPNGVQSFYRGNSPFDNCNFGGASRSLLAIYDRPTFPIYSWVANDGRANIHTWIEKAAKAAGR